MFATPTSHGWNNLPNSPLPVHVREVEEEEQEDEAPPHYIVGPQRASRGRPPLHPYRPPGTSGESHAPPRESILALVKRFNARRGVPSRNSLSADDAFPFTRMVDSRVGGFHNSTGLGIAGDRDVDSDHADSSGSVGPSSVKYVRGSTAISRVGGDSSSGEVHDGAGSPGSS